MALAVITQFLFYLDLITCLCKGKKRRIALQKYTAAQGLQIW